MKGHKKMIPDMGAPPKAMKMKVDEASNAGNSAVGAVNNALKKGKR